MDILKFIAKAPLFLIDMTVRVGVVMLVVGVIMAIFGISWG